MKRLTALTLATALGLAACGASGGATAATVDGQTITVDDVNGMLSLDEGAVTKTQFAQILGLLVEWSIVEKAAAEELGLTVTDDEITAEADRIFEEFADEGQSREDFVATRGFTEAFLQMVGHQEALYRKIHDKFLDEGRGVPSEEEIAEGMDARRLAMTSACVSHILLGELQGLEGDELESAKEEALAEAEEVLGLLDDGGDFAEIARERSTDTGSGAQGGDLGCQSPQRWVEPFRDAVLEAPVGEVFDEPVLSDFGYHIIFVSERTVPTDEEVAESLTTDGVRGEIDAWVGEKMAAADVTVTTRFGTWDSTGLQVVPPEA